MMKELMLCKAADFIVFFGLAGVAYCCPDCLELPTNPKMWARLLAPNYNFEDWWKDLTEAANKKDLPTSRAHWYCPNDQCAKKV